MTVETESLSEAIDRKAIVTGLQVETKEEVFAKLAELLHQQGNVDSVSEFIDAIHEREAQGATGIGGHVAIPHGRSDTVKRNAIAIAILDHEIPWESLDDTGAKVVALFAVGADDEGSQQHLKLLSQFARKLAKDDVTQALLKAQTVDDVVEALNK
ncbi:PTS mannose transporter subunit IIAB [Bombiscardovia apis]|uniref:PTS mannose transporter subunit IIAB n=1 Tax=Bombiscardovia apis TaxID=2932182 RepID=A0ABM8BAR7_9BIFI|nr:fructose PTS transporter subunit IIA [Bombiscardovia apis]BDR53913.1 PTS mannose transporter subunit IIAB [Bombiscardovia apis]